MPDETTTTPETAPPPPPADPPAAPPPDLAGELATAKVRMADLEAERDLARVGIHDEEGVALARFLHSRLPEADRPSLTDWARTGPKGLAPYLPQAAPPPVAPPAPAAGAPPVAPPAAPPAPPVSTMQAGGTVASSQAGAAPGTGTIGAAEIARERLKAVETGDYTKLRELMTRYNGLPAAKS